MTAKWIVFGLILLWGANSARGQHAGAFMKAAQDSDPHVRAMAARALGEAGERSAVPLLISMLEDEHGFVRDAAAAALGKLGDDSAVPALIRKLKEERLPAIAPSEEGLIIGDRPGPLPELVRQQAVQRQITAMRALSALRDARATEPLIELGLRSPEVSIQIEAAVALGRIGGRQAAQALREVLENYYRTAPEEPSEPLIIGTNPADPLQRLRQWQAYLRTAVVWALGECGDAAALSVLTRATNDENSIVRDEAGYALEKIARRLEASR